MCACVCYLIGIVFHVCHLKHLASININLPFLHEQAECLACAPVCSLGFYATRYMYIYIFFFRKAVTKGKLLFIYIPHALIYVRVCRFRCRGPSVVWKAVQESVTASVEMMLTYCHSPGVLRAATAILVNSKKGECAGEL